MTAVLALDEVSKSYPGSGDVLRAVSLDIAP